MLSPDSESLPCPVSALGSHWLWLSAEGSFSVFLNRLPPHRTHSLVISPSPCRHCTLQRPPFRAPALLLLAARSAPRSRLAGRRCTEKESVGDQ
jgi:hypothetical protein